MTTATVRTTRSKLSALSKGLVPDEMSAAALDKFGPPQVLSLHAFPVPLPGPGEVLIELHAAGVGVWDASVRNGSWRPFGRPKFPLIPGTDGAGIVVMKGPRVRRFDIGDRVWAYHYANPKGGFYAEYVTVDVDHVGSMPRRLSFLEAGASATTGLTALQGIDDALRVQKGETVLIFGATGGVGTLAVQFAKRKRARVIATASDSEASTLVKKLGADEIFDARGGGAGERLQILAHHGIDAALVLAGSDTLEACLDLVTRDGRIAYPNGVWPEPSHGRQFRVISYDAEPGPRQFERLEHAAAEAGLTVPIAGVYPIEQAAKAHERLENGHVLGRIALRMGHGSR